MKIYNKKGVLLGLFWLTLAAAGIAANLMKPDPNELIRVRDWVLAGFILLLGLNSFWRAFSRGATREDRIEAMDERNHMVELKSKARMLDIVYGILFFLMACGVIGFKMTAGGAWFALLVIPGFLLGLFLLLQVFVKLWYEKRG